MASSISSLVKYRSQQHQDQQLKRLNRGICCPESALIRSVRAAISRLYFEHGHAFVRSPPLRSVSAFAAQKEAKKSSSLRSGGPVYRFRSKISFRNKFSYTKPQEISPKFYLTTPSQHRASMKMFMY